MAFATTYLDTNQDGRYDTAVSNRSVPARVAPRRTTTYFDTDQNGIYDTAVTRRNFYQFPRPAYRGPAYQTRTSLYSFSNPTTTYTDVNGDGYADFASTDANGDGYVDHHSVYSSVFTQPTTTYTDYNGDGYADEVSTDVDGDGYVDHVRRY